ncbi:MAG: nuclear transport factor 2 family protein [Alphaproteobacteria bacterium]
MTGKPFLISHDRELSHAHKIRIAYAAWARGDATPLLSMIADDCEFTIMGNLAVNPNAGTRIGPLGFQQSIIQFQEMFEVKDIEFERIIGEGDALCVLWSTVLVVRATGRIIECERCDFIEFAEGKVKRARCFYDSATMALTTGFACVAPRGNVAPPAEVPEGPTAQAQSS